MLAQGDSTSATGWLRKSNFSEHKPPTPACMASSSIPSGSREPRTGSATSCRETHICRTRNSSPCAYFLSPFRFPRISQSFRCCPSCPLVDLASSITASDQGVGEGTHQKLGLAWSHWQLWLKSIDLFDDKYLQAFEHRTRSRLLGAFAAAVRAGRFSTRAYDRLAASVVSGSVDHVAATFLDAGHPATRPPGPPSLQSRSFFALSTAHLQKLQGR
jgi:hypothetical protein